MTCVRFLTCSAFLGVWFLVGLASRICVDHGLHHETEHSTVSLSPLELDTRRRLFHIVYSLDRLLGNALGRPPSIPDEYIDVPVSRKNNTACFLGK